MVNIQKWRNNVKTNKLQKTSLSLLYKARKFALSIKEGNDAEDLHQFRINLRKLRSIFKDFKVYLKKSSSKNMNKKLKFLLTSSNKLRDTDVFLKYLEEYSILISDNLQKEFSLLSNKIKQERAFEYKNILKLIDSEKFTNHLDSVEKILKKDNTYKKDIWKDFKETKNKVLKKIQKKVEVKKEKLYKNSNSKTFHKLRILYKRQRYLNELFVSKNKSNINEFKEIQDILGNIQDLCVQQRMLKKYLTKDLKPLVKFLIDILKIKEKDYKVTFLH